MENSNITLLEKSEFVSWHAIKSSVTSGYITALVICLIAAVFELPSVEGVIDILEGEEYEEELRSSGFSYSTVPIRVYSLTYSEYTARGYTLEDDFDSNVIPADAADGMLVQ